MDPAATGGFGLDPGADLLLVDDVDRVVLRLDANEGVISMTAPSGGKHRLLFQTPDGDVILYPRTAELLDTTDRVMNYRAVGSTRNVGKRDPGRWR